MSPTCLTVLLLSLFAVVQNNDISPTSETEQLRAEVCAEACHDAMHWDLCAVRNKCDRLHGQERLFCLDNCLYAGVDCELSCWDSYDVIMTQCSGACAEKNKEKKNEEREGENSCGKRCFLERYDGGRR